MSGARLRVVCRGRLRALLPIVVGALFTACASGGGHRADATESGKLEAKEASSNLVIENNSWDRVTIYVAAGGQPWRLGDVEGTSAKLFSLDKYRFAVTGREVYLVARPLAGAPFRSEGFSFSPGLTTVWTIENATALSHLAMR